MYYPVSTEQKCLDLDRVLDRDLDLDPEDAPIYTGHSLFNIPTIVTLLFNVQSSIYGNLHNIWIKIIQNVTQIAIIVILTVTFNNTTFW